MYLPDRLIPNLEELDFTEFYDLCALAHCARKLRVEDIEEGTAKGTAKAIGGERN